MMAGRTIYRKLARAGTHVVLIMAAYMLAYALRFDFSIPKLQLSRLIYSLPVVTAMTLLVFERFGLLRGLWRYVSMSDAIRIAKAKGLASFLSLAVLYAVTGYGVPRSIFVLDWVFCVALLVGVRALDRALYESRTDRRTPRAKATETGDRALIVGAGNGAEALLREIKRSRTLNHDVVGLVDDGPWNQGRSIHGVPVIGNIEQLPDLCKSRHIDKILIAIPSATPAQRGRILERCRASRVPVKSLPTVEDLLEGKASVGELQEVRAEDILGRAPVHVDPETLRSELADKRILVTGAGGSIGAELCRQLALFEPELIVLLERAESSLQFIELELLRGNDNLEIVPVVGDINDQAKLDGLFATYRPDIVYHAAAYKHVHLMEKQPLDAINNNIFGTEILARAASRAGVAKFVFVSTDKAVRPVGVMGRTKRVAEDLLVALDQGDTKFVSVRFGNVLGSDGSVLPLFQRQIARRDPVTLTDPNATRYFMLLAEAAQLLLQAGAMGNGREVFFLEMGDPMRIADLAEGLIRLSGLKPKEDVPVVVTGLRPGERLDEELVREAEELIPSAHDKIKIVRNRGFQPALFWRDLEELRGCARDLDEPSALAQLEAMTAVAETSVIHVQDHLVDDSGLVMGKPIGAA